MPRKMQQKTFATHLVDKKFQKTITEENLQFFKKNTKQCL